MDQNRLGLRLPTGDNCCVKLLFAQVLNNDRICEIYNCFIHLDIKDGKIWIQRNQTDRSFADELVQMGIAKEEIVLGVQPPYAREYTGFGVA